MYIYLHIHIYTHTHIYIYISRKRKERWFELPMGALDVSINQSKFLTSHTRPRRSHIPAPPQRAANPASRSVAGLGGCNSVAAAPSMHNQSINQSTSSKATYAAKGNLFQHCHRGGKPCVALIRLARLLQCRLPPQDTPPAPGGPPCSLMWRVPLASRRGRCVRLNPANMCVCV